MGATLGQKRDTIKAVLPASILHCERCCGLLPIKSVRFVSSIEPAAMQADLMGICKVVGLRNSVQISNKISPEGQTWLKQQTAQGSRKVLARQKSRWSIFSFKIARYGVQRSGAGCNAQEKLGPQGQKNLIISTQGMFLRHLSKIAAPLHHFISKSLFINGLYGVQRGVQQGATGCNAGATEATFRALHPELKSIPSRVLPYLVQWCNAKNVNKKFSRRSIEGVMLELLIICVIIFISCLVCWFVVIDRIQLILENVLMDLRPFSLKNSRALHPNPGR